MALAINDFESRDGGARDRLSRGLGVAAALYALMGLITGALALASALRLADLVGDPSALAPAQMLGLPWSLAAGSEPTTSLLVTLGALLLNFVILLVAARLARGRVGRA